MKTNYRYIELYNTWNITFLSDEGPSSLETLDLFHEYFCNAPTF